MDGGGGTEGRRAVGGHPSCCVFMTSSRDGDGGKRGEGSHSNALAVHTLPPLAPGIFRPAGGSPLTPNAEEDSPRGPGSRRGAWKLILLVFFFFCLLRLRLVAVCTQGLTPILPLPKNLRPRGAGVQTKHSFGAAELGSRGQTSAKQAGTVGACEQMPSQGDADS